MGFKLNSGMYGLLYESTWLHVTTTLTNSRISFSNASLISSESYGVKFQSKRLWVKLGINKHCLWILLNLKPIYQTAMASMNKKRTQMWTWVSQNMYMEVVTIFYFVYGYGLCQTNTDYY